MSDAPGGAALPDIEACEEIELSALRAAVQRCRDQRLRFITITCMDMGETFALYYHFDEKLKMRHLLVHAPRAAEVASISDIYFAAFLVENEVRELFGVNITGMAIDYHGHLLLTEDNEPTPMAKVRMEG
jgi:NADH:ubiquinone oxidoreductase subunit C